LISTSPGTLAGGLYLVTPMPQEQYIALTLYTWEKVHSGIRILQMVLIGSIQ